MPLNICGKRLKSRITGQYYGLQNKVYTILTGIEGIGRMFFGFERIMIAIHVRRQQFALSTLIYIYIYKNVHNIPERVLIKI